MEVKSLKCPSCGAIIECNEKVSFCSYCGAKLFIDDGSKNININLKNEDVSKIKEIEAKKEIELKRIELEDKHKISRWRHFGYAYITCSNSGYVFIGV